MATLLEALEIALTKLRRKRVSRKVFQQNGGVVRHGVFTGLKLNGNANTSQGNLGAKTCGLYEWEVIAQIAKLGPFKDVVNFGGADGYFSLGPLIAGLAERSICFEMTEKGRAEIATNAANNGLAEKIVIKGAVDATAGSVLAELAFDPQSALVLCDIEGAEFTVLTSELLAYLKGATLIIELHDRLMSEGTVLREDLIARLPDGAQTTVITGGPADWRDIPSITELSDNDRALVCSDGRRVLGEWLLVTYPEA